MVRYMNRRNGDMESSIYVRTNSFLLVMMHRRDDYAEEATIIIILIIMTTVILETKMISNNLSPFAVQAIVVLM